MASDRGISGVLAFLHELFPTREIGPATLDAWALVFADWDDDELQRCAVLAAKTPGRTFFPTPGEIAAFAPKPPAPDVDALLLKIHDLGEYSPRVGWCYPSLQSIREQLGEAVGDAYAEAGAGRCFADADRNGQSTTRDIARREFAAALIAHQAKTPRRLAAPGPFLLAP